MNRRTSRTLGLLLLTALGATGCDQPTSDSPYQPSQNVERQEHDDFERGFELVSGFGEFDPEQASLEASFRFNQWLKEQPEPAWEVDPLVAGLPEALRRSPPIQQLGRDSVKVEDMYYLRQVLWGRQISEWVSEQDPNPLLVAWFEEKGGELGKTTLRQLRMAERLFDWTIRNVQLEPPLASAEQEWAAQQAEGAPPPPRGQSLAGLGVPGPGYTAYPWEVLLYGRGDADQRARVFALLARQQGIPVVMVQLSQAKSPDQGLEDQGLEDQGLEDQGLEDQEVQLPAVFLNKQLYLFDTMLGLPLPDESGRGIATLAQIQANPQLLDNLDIGSQYVYPVKAEDVERVDVLLDAAPQAISKRMKQIENRLTGERRLVLTLQASRLARQLRDLDGVDEVRLWSVPFETVLFRNRMDALLQNNEAARAAFLRERAPFLGINSLVRGRNLHFRHRFEEEDSAPGAKQRYMEVRLPDQKIARLPNDLEVQREYGLQRDLDEREDDWLNRIRYFQMVSLQGKMHATYWMGLIHYENGDYQDAVYWLRDRTLQSYPDGPWTAAAHYNLGRAYEALHRWEDARQLYLVDDSPQQHGNLLRAEILEAEQE